MPTGNKQAIRRMALELDVARHLVMNGAPIVGPTNDWPAGPHVEGDFIITLWNLVEHDAADGENACHLAEAADALRRFHCSLADYGGQLPSFWAKLDQCRAVLANEMATPALKPADRAFLLSTYERFRATVTSIPTKFIPIHGDAHLGNVFITPEGARWNDFEDVSLGPREWDVSWLPEVDLAPFGPLNPELLSAFHYLRSLCTAAWCWAKYDVPEKQEAADYHLGYLKAELGGNT